MKTKSIILTIILGIFYPFSLTLRVKKNRITFISLEHDNLSKDFKLIYDRLKKKDQYELRTVLFKFESSLWGNIKYGYACIRQLFLIESSLLITIILLFPSSHTVRMLKFYSCGMRQAL